MSRTNPVAETIAQQIGGRAFTMLGARELIGDTNSLTFRIGRNAQGVSHVRVQLDPSDTYTVQFLKVSRPTRRRGVGHIERKVLSEVSDVYVEDLRKIIESKTGLYTNL